MLTSTPAAGVGERTILSGAFFPVIVKWKTFSGILLSLTTPTSSFALSSLGIVGPSSLAVGTFASSSSARVRLIVLVVGVEGLL